MELGNRRFFWGCYNQDIFKDPFERHFHDVGVLYNKDYKRAMSKSIDRSLSGQPLAPLIAATLLLGASNTSSVHGVP